MLMCYTFTPDSSFKSLLPKTQNRLDKLVCFTMLMKLYLLGNLPFFKIHVNHFVARGDSPGGNFISIRMLWVRGLVPL